METNLSALKTHDWITSGLETVAGTPIIQHVCRGCGRGFVEERSTGALYAVHVSIFKLHRLSDDVTSRWLFEECPAQRLMADDADRRTRSVEGPFGSALGATLYLTKAKDQSASACATGPITNPSRHFIRRPSGAASSKSISIGVQRAARQLLRNSPRTIRAR